MPSKPKMDHTERAARDLINLKVREGIIDRRNGNEIIRTGLPFITVMLARWRREGTSPQWITEKFQTKLAEAKQQAADAPDSAFAQQRARLSVVAAEMYLAAWAGMQADLGQYLADLKTADQAAAVDAAPPAIEPAP
ncbi:hypothetical protein ACGFR8_07840 [Streptomyces brevispora]|uniref:hypothetical protein n=1 Tax=Streptomyces brevispora TaxID=887462 RepID=UPI00371CAD8F